MLTFALFGAGRIGKIHAANLSMNRAARLRFVSDVDATAAEALAQRHGATVASIATSLADPTIDAVIIASSTDTHADLAMRAARAGKAIFCEKPIDLSLSRVDACLAEVEKAGVPMLVGFNRRFDPSFAALKSRIAAGAIGNVEQVIISSRDPAPPPLSYLRVSGGQLRDMTIHDFDMARWLLGEEPEEVFAYGSALVDLSVAEAGDTDSLMVLMRTPSGRLAHINNSRRASYGYDQRIEVHGASGRIMADNRTATSVELSDASAVQRDRPLDFFLERYGDAYRLELAAFIDAVTARSPMPVGARDGRMALVLAEAAIRSMDERRPVRIDEIMGARP
ncbi:MAG: inositol 2-dehydrogenase [Hyphomicrobiaceae bacterium]